MYKGNYVLIRRGEFENLVSNHIGVDFKLTTIEDYDNDAMDSEAIDDCCNIAIKINSNTLKNKNYKAIIKKLVGSNHMVDEFIEILFSSDYAFFDMYQCSHMLSLLFEVEEGSIFDTEVVFKNEDEDIYFFYKTHEII